MYQPDAWTIVKITPNDTNIEPHYRVFAGWYGGYAGSDSWKMNSGITKIDDGGDYYDFHGYSGSVYRCYKGSERMTGYMAQIYAGFQSNEYAYTLIQLDFEDFKKEFKC